MEALAHTLLLAILFLLLASFSPVAAQEDGIDIYSLTMDSRITSRFAHTTIISHVVNKAEQVQEATFQVEMPQRAFITNFSMWCHTPDTSPMVLSMSFDICTEDP